jgi:predicted NBD/HSP70 family sugar kinase
LQLTGSTTDLRRHNRDVVLRLIRRRGSISRTEISGCVGLTNAAVSRITKELIEAGLIKEADRICLKGQAGRRQVLLKVRDDAAYVVAIAMTLNAREIAIANAAGRIITRVDCSDISLHDYRSAIAAFAGRAKRLIANSGVRRDLVLGGGVSIAGRVDPIDGRLKGSEPLAWDGVQVADELTARLDLPFVCEGRAAALLSAEHELGQAVDLSDVFLINIGLKIGTASMLDGRFLRGIGNHAFKLGDFLTGRDQRLDDTASGFAILERLRSAGYAVPLGSDAGNWLRNIAEQAHETDAGVRRAFRCSGKALGRAIAQLAPILAPQAIILAGFVIRETKYIEGVRAGLGDCEMKLLESRFTTTQSAVHLALDHHLFREAHRIRRLAAA